MGLFDDVFRGVTGVGTLGLSEVVRAPFDQQSRAEEYEAQLAGQRETARQRQLGLIGKMQAPQVSPQYERRIQALEQESLPRPVSQEPLYQGERAELLGGGARALSAIQNQQLGRGISGGYQNVGSPQDIQDRLSMQLAQLAQTSRREKEQKRDIASQARQHLLDAQTEFENSKVKAQMAIEAGDSQLANAYLQQAYNAREAASRAQMQMYGQILGLAGTIGGAAIGKPPTSMPQASIEQEPSLQQQSYSMPQSSYSQYIQPISFEAQPRSEYYFGDRPFWSMR